MSTCPDTSLYSAYVDGEVPSPWKEKIEAHLATCEQCRAVERRYRALHNAMQKIGDEAPLATDEFLESSFKKLSPRWEIAAKKAAAERASERTAFSRKHTALHYVAIAAVLLVVAFVPSFFAVRVTEGRMSEMSSMQTAQTSDGSMTLAGARGGDYGAPHSASGTVYITAGVAQNGEEFTLINQAKMFAQDKEVFSSPAEGYVIIRLPEMVRFGGEPPEKGRGFSHMRQPEQRRGESGYIINVMQR